MIVKITYSENTNVSEVSISDLPKYVIIALNDRGLSLPSYSYSNSYYINTETVNYTGDLNFIQKEIERAQQFKLKKRSNTINKILNG